MRHDVDYDENKRREKISPKDYNRQENDSL